MEVLLSFDGIELNTGVMVLVPGEFLRTIFVSLRTTPLQREGVQFYHSATVELIFTRQQRPIKLPGMTDTGPGQSAITMCEWQNLA